MIDLAMIFPLLLITFLFRITKQRKTKYQKLEEKTHRKYVCEKSPYKSKKKALPWCFRYFLYLICFSCMIVSLFFTILKGLSFFKLNLNINKIENMFFFKYIKIKSHRNR